MTIAIYAVLTIVLILYVPYPAQAAPTTGDATDVSSNNFTVPISGASGDTWVSWGQLSGYPQWSSYVESDATSITVTGAPLVGGSTVYYEACDNTGCGSEKTVSIPAITAVPTPQFGAAYKNLSAHRFAITYIPAQLMSGYLANGTPLILYMSILFFCLFFGYFFRTRSVRMALIVGLLLSPFIVSATSGLFLGIVLPFQMVAAMFIPAVMAAIFVSFMKK